MVKSNTSTILKSKEERPAEVAIEKYCKDRYAFIHSLSLSLKNTHDDTAARRAAPYLLHLIRDPDLDIVLSACRAVNVVLQDSYGLIFDAKDAIHAFCRCFDESSRKNISDITVQQVIAESSSGIVMLWSLLPPESFELVHCVDELLACATPCLECLNSNIPHIEACGIRVLSTMYDPKHGAVSYEQVSDMFDHVFRLIRSFSCDATLITSILNLLTLSVASLPPARIDEVLKEGYEYMNGEDAEEEIVLSIMDFIESSIVHKPISGVIDARMCDVLCRYVENGIENKRSTSIIALQILARLVNEDQKFALMLETHDMVLGKMCQCVEDIDSSQLLPSLFIIGHVSKASPLACEIIMRHTVNVPKCMAVVLVHCEQGNVKQVAAWVLGVLGSSSSSSARKVTESGALLAMIDAISKSGEDNDDVCKTCHESSIAIIENLDFLAALEALLKLDSIPKDLIITIFHQIYKFLQENRIFCSDFVQSGSLETLISLGENNPDLQEVTKSICDLYPQELVNRCSPKYMEKLIDKFKRDSVRDFRGGIEQQSKTSLLSSSSISDQCGDFEYETDTK